MKSKKSLISILSIVLLFVSTSIYLNRNANKYDKKTKTYTVNKSGTVNLEDKYNNIIINIT